MCTDTRMSQTLNANTFYIYITETHFQHSHFRPPKFSFLCPPTLLSSPGSLPLRRRMDDEEEDMSRPISQLWGTPLWDNKYEDRATQIAAGQALAAVTATVPMSQSHNNNSIGVNILPCVLYRQPRIPFQGNVGGMVEARWSSLWVFETDCTELKVVLPLRPHTISHSFYGGLLNGNHPQSPRWLKQSIWFDKCHIRYEQETGVFIVLGLLRKSSSFWLSRFDNIRIPFSDPFFLYCELQKHIDCVNFYVLKYSFKLNLINGDHGPAIFNFW